MKVHVINCCLLFFIGLPPLYAMNNSQATNDACHRLFDYQKAEQAIEPSWILVNDNVMGGKSSGQFTINEHYLTFSGFINTNGGGFSSMRHPVPSLPFGGANHIQMSVRSDGRTYNLSLADKYSRQQGISHRASINANESTEFQEVNIQLDDMKPMFRGRAVQSPDLDRTEIQELRIMLSDNIDGEFSLDIAWLDICW